MAESSSNAMAGKIGDAALQAKTGKTWEEWFAVLDAAGAAEKSHSETTQHLYDELGIDGWWAQMITVGYEQARGKRVKHQKANGYEISVSRTLPVSAATLFGAWQDEAVRGRWLPEPGVVVRKATPDKSMRLGWPDQTLVSVDFYPKGDSKTQVAVQHSKLPDSEAAGRMKDWWGDVLNRLKTELVG